MVDTAPDPWQLLGEPDLIEKLCPRPVLVVLYKDVLPGCMAAIESVAEVRYTTADELAAALPGADVLLLWDYFSSAVQDVWEFADSLNWIHVAAAGVDKLLFDELIASGVIVTNSRGIFDRPIAEFVLASILGFAKDLPGSLRRQQRMIWEHRETERIDGSRTLIVGTGSIGRETARLLKAVGVHVQGVGRSDRIGDPDFDVVHSSCRLAEVVRGMDYVVLIAPLTDITREMVNVEVLRAMKPSARLINVGRGELVNDADLLDALRDGVIAGAALDVFSTEPLPQNSPYWAMQNVLISAHLSGDAAGWRDSLAMLFTENLHRYVSGKELVNVIDKQLGFFVAR